MYDATDPRSTLGQSTSASTPAGPEGIAAPEFYDFTREAPDYEAPGGGRTWVVRGQNMMISYSTPAADQDLHVGDTAGEIAVILPTAESAVHVTAGDTSMTVQGPALAVVAPGSSAIRSTSTGDVALISEAAESNWSTPARNTDSYRVPHPRVAPLTRWPEPAVQESVRVYPMEDVPTDPSRFGRIFRTRSFMINFLLPNEGPRDPSALSPHHHDDFEQASLAISGEFVHHIRTPWLSDRRRWREDDHEFVASPSVAVIPPPTIHTTEPTGSGTNFLIDIFSPPREDFSDKPGWVLNESDYPRIDSKTNA